MKKYEKPEMKMVSAQLWERIAGDCWGTPTNANDSINITVNGNSYQFTESSPPAGSWGDCSSGILPNTLFEQIKNYYNTVLRLGLNFQPINNENFGTNAQGNKTTGGLSVTASPVTTGS